MICRVCLYQAKHPLEIFDANGEQLNIAYILQQHFWFKPLPEDTISTVICLHCWCKVNDFHKFYVAVENAHMTLHDHDIKGECDIEDLTDQQIEAEHQVKNELEDTLMENSYTGKEMDNLNAQDAGDHSNSNQKSKPQRINVASELKTVMRKRKPTKVKDEINDNTAAAKRKLEFEANKTRDDELVKKHIPMGCDLCTFIAEDFTQMSEHFKKQHEDIKPYIICCDRKLNKRFLVVQHACKHEDPDYFKCKECQKVLANMKFLRLHMAANHASEEELKYKCDQCEKRFSRLTFLKKHMPSHIPVHERKFHCEKCPESKAFASSKLLQIHLSTCHRKVAIVCHICAKEIRNKQTFTRHMRMHLGTNEPRLKCPRSDCDSWLKDEVTLRHHLGRHNDEGKIFTCQTCGKECKNRTSLSAHIHYAHSNEVFPCNLCQKTFKKAITLKEHMAQHTGEILYSCPFCTRSFNSNANMHSHKKKMHPIEWDSWRKTKGSTNSKNTSNII